MTTAPLSPSAAKKLAREILVTGKVVILEHCKLRMAERSVTVSDLMNVIRGGVYEPAEWENDAWRYRASTTNYVVVIEFDGDTIVILVSTWRKK